MKEMLIGVGIAVVSLIGVVIVASLGFVKTLQAWAHLYGVDESKGM